MRRCHRNDSIHNFATCPACMAQASCVHPQCNGGFAGWFKRIESASLLYHQWLVEASEECLPAWYLSGSSKISSQLLTSPQKTELCSPWRLDRHQSLPLLHTPGSSHSAAAHTKHKPNISLLVKYPSDKQKHFLVHRRLLSLSLALFTGKNAKFSSMFKSLNLAGLTTILNTTEKDKSYTTDLCFFDLATVGCEWMCNWQCEC